MGVDVIRLSLNRCRKKMASLGKERQDLLSTIDALKEGKMLIVKEPFFYSSDFACNWFRVI